MNKISMQVISLLKSNINLIISTHSHYQLEKIWHLYSELPNKNHNYKFNLLITSNANLYDKDFDIKIFNEEYIHNSIIGINFRERNILFKCFFISNIFLVEGLKDYQFLYCIINQNYSNFSYEIIDCFGKTVCFKIKNILETKFNINAFLLFDKDGDKNINLNYSYGFEQNIENDLKLNNDKSDCSEINMEKIKNILKKYKKSNELIKSIDKYLNR